MEKINNLQAIIAGACFDLMGFLTTLPEEVQLGARHDASEAVRLLTVWASNRGLSLEQANVSDWNALIKVATSEGVIRISRERARQILEERFDADHDAQHQYNELVEAAIAYAMAPGKVYARRDMDDPGVFLFEEVWPWEETLDKRGKHDRLHRLEIAGALIAAEIDRMLLDKSEATDFEAVPS